MSLFQKVLAGIGSYLVKEHDAQEAFDMQKARDQLLFDRDVALKAVEHGYTVQEGDQALARAKELDVAQTSDSMVRDKAQAEYKSAADTESDTRDLRKAIVLKGLDLSNDTKLAKLKHDYQLSEDQAKAMADLSNNLAVAGQTVDRIVFTKDGSGVAYSKTGKKIGQTSAGIFNPSGNDGSGSDLGDYLNSGGTASGSSISRTTAQPTPKIGGDSQARADFANRYAAATPQTSPGLFRNGQKIPMDEAWNLYSGN